MFKQTFALTIILLLASCSQHLQKTESLKKHGLLFMLHDYRQRVEYYEKKGMVEKAQAERASIAKQNRAIVQHFKREFDFCPVYFFYSSQYEDLAAGKPVLLNDQLRPEASIPLPQTMIVADYGLGNVEENTFKLASFRIDSLGIKISPTYKTRYKSETLEARDVRKFNKKLKRMHGK